MSRKGLLLIVMVLVAIAAGVYTCREFNRKNANVSELKAAYEVQASDLIKEFSNNDSAATKKYLGKIVSVNGHVKKIEHDADGFYTLILGDSTEPSSVLCAMDTTERVDASNLHNASSLKIRGFFIGFEKDETGLLGSDVKLNRCIIEKTGKLKAQK
jgi:hypothetical protein